MCQEIGCHSEWCGIIRRSVASAGAERLRSVNPILQTDHGAVAGEIDRRLDRAGGLDGHSIEWAGWNCRLRRLLS
jgi:hypothetical protein